MSDVEKDFNEQEEVQQSTCDIIMEELPKLKWRVLVMCCFLTFGSYYIYDFPGSIGTGPEHTIQALFKQKGKTYNQAMNLALYSVYSWPNSVIAIFGGLLIDKYLGLRRAMLLFCFLVTTGAGLFYVGVRFTNYPLMIVARVIFGLGGESLSVAQSAFVARWFKSGRGMALAFGITVSFSRVGSSFNFLFSPMIAKDINIEAAVAMGLGACAFSLLSCTGLIFLDVLGSKRGDVPPETKDTAAAFNFKEIKELPALLWIACGITVFSYCSIFPFVGIAENFFQVKFGIDHESAGQVVSLYQFTSAGGSPVVGFLVDNIGRFCYWIIAACTGFGLVHVVLIFTMTPPEVMMVVLGLFYSLLVSSLWPSIPYCVDPAFIGFAYGVITALQNFGLAAFPLMTGTVLDIYTPPEPPLPGSNSTMSGSSSTSASTDMSSGSDSTWSAPHHDEIQAISTTTAAISTTMAPPVPTPAPTKQKAMLPTLEGYKWAEFIFICSALLSVILAVVFLLVDRKQHGGMLAASPKDRETKKKELEEAAKEKEGLLNSDKAVYEEAP